jgi:nucleoside-diphosphate-sugar epimerase
VYGTRDFDRVIPIFVNQALRGLPLTLFGGKQILDFIWIDTVVESLVRVGWGDVPKGPMNIGSGQPTDLITLAKRVLLEANSRSELRIAAAREVEVSQFVADTSFMRHTFAIETTEDPLRQLTKVIGYAVRDCTTKPMGLRV